MPEPAIRLATLDEAADVADVLREAFEPYRPQYTPAAFAATTPSAEQVRQRWHEGPVWVAVQDARVVATVSAVPRGPGAPLFTMTKTV